MGKTVVQLLSQVHLPNSSTARLDAELLLGAVLNKPRSFLRTWSEFVVDDTLCELFDEFLIRRRAGEPIAYLLGKQGFWSFDLKVNTSTLIPRADTETLVEHCLGYIDSEEAVSVLDLGTGTGAVALAIAVERKNAQVLGVDYIEEAVMLANENKFNLALDNVSFLQSNWFSRLEDKRFHFIVSNPPYIELEDVHLKQGDVAFEPRTALVSGEDGLDDIRLIIEQAPNYLYSEGWLFFEHGYQQSERVRLLLIKKGFVEVSTVKDLGGNERVTGGKWVCS